MTVKHICILSDDYPTRDRMVFVFVQQLVEALVDDNVEISVVAPQSLTRSLIRKIGLLPKRQTYTTEKGNIYMVYRPYSLSFGNGNAPLYKLANSFNQRRIEKCLKSINPQIVYGHFWHNAIKGANYAVTYKKPLFVACGEGDDALDSWAVKLSKDRRESVRKMINGVISVSTENKRKCLSYGLCNEDGIVVLPNCVNDKVFYPHNCVEFRKQLGASTSDFVISFTGAFINRKGYNRLSQAINKLNSNVIKVIFCGKPLPGYEDEMPCCNGIIHCGAVDHNDLPKYLCASDLFVLPTLKEGCCNAIVEALACGIPVVSSDRPFNDDILNEKNSVVINPESVDDIANTIKQLMTDKDLYSTLKKNTLAQASNYSIVIRAKKIKEFIQSKI